MNKVLLGYCPLCGERYPKDHLTHRNHDCSSGFKFDANERPSFDGAALEVDESVA